MRVSKKKIGRPVAGNQLNRAAILEIALQEFAQKGFDGTRQRDIAQKAGISNGSMNYHFKSKEDLWRLAVLQMGETLKRDMEESHSFLKDLKGVEALKAYTRQYIYFSAKNPAFNQIIFHEMCTKTARAKWLTENILGPIYQLFDKDNSRVQDGLLVFKGYQVANLSSIIIGASSTFFINAFQMEELYGVDSFDEKEVKRHADMVIDLVFARLG